MKYRPLIDRKEIEDEGKLHEKNFYWFQSAQRDHDMMYHRDIFFMDHADRFKHVLLHYGKYSRRIASLITEEPENVWQPRIDMQSTLVDSFIMTLNLLEIFNIHFKDAEGSLSDTEDIIAKKQPELYKHLSEEDSKMRFLLQYVKIYGYLAKVAEELDHMLMEINRKQVEEEIIKMVKLHLLAGKIWQVNYWERIPYRWKEIEEKRIV